LPPRIAIPAFSVMAVPKWKCPPVSYRFTLDFHAPFQLIL
jgi:hypothetical protein